MRSLNIGQGAEERKQSRYRKGRIPMIAVSSKNRKYLALAFIAILAALWIRHERRSEAAVPGAAPFHLSAAQLEDSGVVRIKAAPLQQRLAIEGEIAFDGERTVPVYSPYTGRVIATFAESGSEVAKGGRLLEVEATESAQARSDAVAARAAVESAGAQAETAQATEAREQALYTVGAAALKDWQQSRTDLAVARGTLAAAQGAFAAAEAKLHILDDNGAASGAGHVYLRAPISGIVVQKQVAGGQNIVSAVAGAASPVYTIADLSRVWVTGNVRESDARRVRAGQPVSITIPAMPGRVFKTTLSWVGAAIDPETRRLPVRATLDNPRRGLQPRMLADLDVDMDAQPAGIRLPEEAIVYDGAAAHVWIVNPDSTVVSRVVKAGAVSAGEVEILDGLREGEQVVTRGPLFLDRAAGH